MSIRVFVAKLIESEQEASDLPAGTIIFRVNPYGEYITGSKIGVNAWETLDRTDDGWDYLDRDVVGWTSLSPTDVLDSLVSAVAERSEFHSVEDVKRRLKERE